MQQVLWCCSAKGPVQPICIVSRLVAFVRDSKRTSDDPQFSEADSGDEEEDMD